MLYGYQKATKKNPHPGRFIPQYLKLAPTLVSALGMVIIASVAWPMISYQLESKMALKPKDTNLLSPISFESNASEDQGPTLLSAVDFTKASTWFPGSAENDLFNRLDRFKDSVEGVPDSYSITIPSQNIENATVSLKDEDLTKALVQYPQTALPGQSGAPVIFGHSSLPQLFDPEKYTTIFSNLPKAKIGSYIFVDYNDKRFTYKITKTYEVKPSELWVLRQDYSYKKLKLITCVPPGTTLKRLIVEADLLTD